MANTFDWIEIRTNNIEATAAFYESLFGWQMIDKVTADGSDVWIFDTGDEPRLQNLRRGGIWLRPEVEQLGFVVYILVDDIGATLEHVTRLGGEVVGPRIPVGAGHAAYFTDPSGNLVALYEERKSG
jgi:predicted enzyme related to lactoylglutathione lyase